jgi:hypothetical protein
MRLVDADARIGPYGGNLEQYGKLQFIPMPDTCIFFRVCYNMGSKRGNMRESMAAF